MMLDQVTQLIRESDLCVLATAGVDGPHTSLMAYACSADARRIFLATSRNSLKYRNLCAEPRVSLMVDTRDQEPRGKVRALTITGRVHEIQDAAEAGAVRTLLLGRHPHLQGLLRQPDVALLCVAVAAVQMLTGPLEAFYLQFPFDNAGYRK